jgi:hypothetical protein
MVILTGRINIITVHKTTAKMKQKPFRTEHRSRTIHQSINHQNIYVQIDTLKGFHKKHKVQGDAFTSLDENLINM